MKTPLKLLTLFLILSSGFGCSTMKMPALFEESDDPPLIRAVQVATGHLSGTPVEAKLMDQKSEENPLIYSVTIVADVDHSLHQVFVNADSFAIVGTQPVLP